MKETARFEPFIQLVKKVIGFFDKLNKHSILHSAKCEKRLKTAVFVLIFHSRRALSPSSSPCYSIFTTAFVLTEVF